MKLSKGANSNRAISLMRQATSKATDKYGNGGRLKTQGPKPITLAKLTFLEPEKKAP